MKPKTLCLLLFASVLLVHPATAQSKKEKRELGKILGDQLDYGRQAASFGLWNEAIFHWEKVVSLDPDNADATNNLAVAYESVGAFEKAEQLYRTALDLNEDNAEIRKNMKRFRSFYRKHKRQLAREQKIKIKRKQDKENKAKAAKEAEEKNNEGGTL